MNIQTIFNTSAIIALIISIYNFLNSKEKVIIIEKKIIKEDETTKDDSTIINENIQFKTLDEVNERINDFKKEAALKRKKTDEENDEEIS